MRILSAFTGFMIGEAGWIAWVLYRDTQLHPGRLYVPETTTGVLVYYASVGIPCAIVAAHVGYLFGCLWSWAARS